MGAFGACCVCLADLRSLFLGANVFWGGGEICFILCGFIKQAFAVKAPASLNVKIVEPGTYQMLFRRADSQVTSFTPDARLPNLGR